MSFVAHLLSPMTDTFTIGDLWWLAMAPVVVAALIARHLQVKHGQLTAPVVRRTCVGVAATLAVGAALLPTVGAGQATSGLPDLISDPPRPAHSTIISGADGDRLVITFDGYIHNIGDGPLDVVGNPQVPGGMVQRVREGGEWREVSTPTVRYETDDGHNHFHLIEVIDYVLWNESQGAETAAGSKIGFCLVDSEQMEPGTDQAYSEELDDFCQEDNPTATSLRMGISAGWRDVYDATTTLQWVDVSEMTPGRYWIGAVTDPNDEIVESDEANNGLVFSDRPAIVPGWIAIDGADTTDGATIEVTLDAEAFGTVGSPAFGIVSGPEHGTLDLAIGAEVETPMVRYTPDAGFVGDDQFEFSVRDASSEFPLDASTATMRLEVTEPGPGTTAGDPPTVLVDSTFFDLTVGEPFTTDIGVAGGGSLGSGSAPVRLAASRLPAGLRLTDGTISGMPRHAGIVEVDLSAVDEAGATGSQTVTFIVAAGDSAGMTPPLPLSSPLGQPVRQALDSATLGVSYTADGLPSGLELEPGSRHVTGTPVEVGVFDVEVVRTEPDGTTASAAFTWTVRTAVAISFAL